MGWCVGVCVCGGVCVWVCVCVCDAQRCGDSCMIKSDMVVRHLIGQEYTV